MVRIRLRRVGKVKQPSFRVVVADSRSPRDGRIIESIGHYNPRTDPSVIEIDTHRAVHWLQQGAQPSDSVRKLLQITGAWEVFTGEKSAEAKAPTPAASVKATPAASTTEETAEAPKDTPAESEPGEE